ncbi:MAG: hypothetical protein GX660_27260 [Clostridiaceae bacterium]|nr:hypothetical protein [Clostridiaceae bacterium]
MEKELVLKAIRNNELVECLEGKGDYKIELDKWVNASAPTDWLRVIEKGIYRIYHDNPEMQIEKRFEDTLLKMMDGEPFDIYVAAAVFYSQLIIEYEGDSPFSIDRNRLLQKIRKVLSDNEQKLRGSFESVGKNCREGLWSEIIRIDTNCKNNWNLSIL